MPFYRVGAGSGSGGGTISRITKTVTLTGSESEILIDLSEYISDYADKTNDMFIVQLNSLSSVATAAETATLTHSYEASTGILTITSSSENMPFSASTSGEIEVQIDIIGTVEVVPEPTDDTPDELVIKAGMGADDLASGKNEVQVFGNSYIPSTYKYYTCTFNSASTHTITVGGYAIAATSTKTPLPATGAVNIYFVRTLSSSAGGGSIATSCTITCYKTN